MLLEKKSIIITGASRGMAPLRRFFAHKMVHA